MKVPDAVFGDDEGYRWEASVVKLNKEWAQLHFDEDDKKHWFTLSEARQWRVEPLPDSEAEAEAEVEAEVEVEAEAGVVVEVVVEVLEAEATTGEVSQTLIYNQHGRMQEAAPAPSSSSAPPPASSGGGGPSHGPSRPSRHGRPLSMLEESDADTEEDEQATLTLTLTLTLALSPNPSPHQERGRAIDRP